jgi:hypothetical protein
MSGGAVDGFGLKQQSQTKGSKGETESASGNTKVDPDGRTLQGEPEAGTDKVDVLRGATTGQGTEQGLKRSGRSRQDAKSGSPASTADVGRNGQDGNCG